MGFAGHPARGRRTVLCLGVGLLAVTGYGLTTWNGLLGAWYLLQSRFDPDLILELADAAQESDRGRGLRALARSTAGRDAILRALGRQFFFAHRHRLDWEKPPLAVLGRVRDGDRIWCRSVQSGGETGGSRQLSFLHDLVADSLPERAIPISVPEHPHLRLTVLRGDLAYLVSGIRMSGGSAPGEEEVTLLVRDASARAIPRPEALPLLAKALAGGSEVRHRLAWEALEAAGIDPRDAAPGILQLLRDDASFITAGIEAIAALGPHAPALAALGSLLADGREWVRLEARRRLEGVEATKSP